MFNNVGKKLQGLAAVTCWIGIIASVITAIVLWVNNSRYNPTILAGIITLVCGCLGSWIGSWAMYGLGEAAESAPEAAYFSQKTNEIYRLLEKQNNEITELKKLVSKLQKAE